MDRSSAERGRGKPIRGGVSGVSGEVSLYCGFVTQLLEGGLKRMSMMFMTPHGKIRE
jgi:hypothetical protein